VISVFFFEISKTKSYRQNKKTTNFLISSTNCKKSKNGKFKKS